MFLKNSRYFGLPTVTGTNRAGASVVAVALRPLPAVVAAPVSIRSHDQLDALSEQRFGDATRYWHIADANSELEAASLLQVTGRPVNVPQS